MSTTTIANDLTKRNAPKSSSPPSSSSSSSSSKPDLASQYGGNSARGWVSHLPASWLPYVQLARLSPPAGIFLIYFPHFFGVLHGALVSRLPLATTLLLCGQMLLGSVFVSNAIHIWNDLIDAPLDALVERTRNRPIPRGAVSTNAALLYAASQAALAVACLGWIPRDWTVGAAWALPGAAGWAYYPYAKRHTHFPQVVLGACIAWGAVMGFLATGTDPFDPTVRAANVCLVLANVVWSMVYDTIYAVQDVEDDVKHGIGSLAVRFRGREKALLWRLVGLMTGLLVAVGGCSGLGLGYYAVAVGGSGLSLGSMVANVNLKDKQSCWWWFSVGFWFAGGAIGGGLLADYLMVGFLNSSLF